MKNIYFELFQKYQDKISENMKNFISLYIISNQNDEIIVLFAGNFKSFLPNILKNINNYALKKEDFWQLKENKNIKVFKGLLEKSEISNEEYREINEYVINSFDIIDQLVKELDKNNLLYKDINIFFENNNENEKKEFEKRILLIYYDSEEKAKNKADEIKSKIEIINNALSNLKLIGDYLKYFFENSEKENIEKIESIISGIYDGPLNYYESNCSEEYSKLKNKYKDIAEKRTKMQKSIFFSALYNANKEKKNLTENEWIENTENQFNNLKRMFSSEGIKSIDNEILIICLNAIKNKNSNEIAKEIDELVEIFEITFSYNKNKIVEKIRLLSKRDEIYEVLYSVYVFINYTNSKKTKFLNSIFEIMSTLSQSYNEENISKAKEELAKVDIDLEIVLEEKKEVKNNYLDILKMLKDLPDSISFLIKITLGDCQTLREKVGEDENIVLDPNKIIDLEKCVSFMNKLKNKKDFQAISDNDLIKLFIKQINESPEDLMIRFKSYTDNYSEIKKLFDSISDRTEAARQKIFSICKSSNFKLNNGKSNYFIGTYIMEMEKEKKKQEKNEGKESKKEFETKSIEIKKIEELLELKDIAQIARKILGDEKEKIIFENNKKFIKIATGIYDFLQS